LDHVVHINNGTGAARPIVLRLLPGEETIFNLKVVNHGEPSNVSLQASSPVLKAVRLKKPDHYVVMEEIIPILARMPDNKKRLDGEILLSGPSGESRVPITLLRDSEDPGDDLEDPGPRGDEELIDDEEEDEDADLAARRGGGDRDDAYDEDGDEEEEDSRGIRRVKRSEDEDEDEGENEDKEEEKEPRRIAFSRDKDLQRYRSATRSQRAGGIESRGEKRGKKPAGSRVDIDRGDADSVENRYCGNGEERDDNNDDTNNSRVEPRFKARIDDRFVDPGNRQDESPRFIPRKVPLGEQEERKDVWKEEEGTEERKDGWKRSTSGYEDRYQGFSQEPGRENREIPVSAADREERASEAPEEPEVYVEQDEGPEAIYLDKLSGLGALGALKVIPVAIFLSLVIVLVLTFITESIPEFPGALASSILIVTLIIYGAATLLKA
jgi:hypothetical protein